VRAKVKHPIGLVKRVFGSTKVRYRRLAGNLHRLGRGLPCETYCFAL
jgi:hypothetical protein